MHHLVPVQVAPTSCRAVWHPLCGLHPWLSVEHCGASEASRMERTRSCTTFSDQTGRPRGRLPPVGWPRRRRLTGGHGHRSSRIASIIVAPFSLDQPSTVSSVIPGVIAPSFGDRVASDRRDRSG
jgi:hypothetical protein